jgi:hypothetical protein
MRQPRIERGAHRWQRWILPLNHWRLVLLLKTGSFFPYLMDRRQFHAKNVGFTGMWDSHDSHLLSKTNEKKKTQKFESRRIRTCADKSTAESDAKT